VQVKVIGGRAEDGGDRATRARDVTPRTGRDGARIAPPPLPSEIQQNQGVAEQGGDATDGAPRTKGASR
jgi:hypothetical protein